MQQKAPQKLVGRQSHELPLLFVFVVLVSERDSTVLQLLEPVVGDGGSGGVPPQTSSGRSLPGGTSAVTGRESAAFQPRRPARCNEGRAGETGSRAHARATGSADGRRPNGCRLARFHHP